MKFHKEFISLTQMLQNDILIENTIPYKFWKKYIKQNKNQLNTKEIIPILEHQCSTVNNTFKKELEYIIRPKKQCILPWCNQTTDCRIPLEYRKKDLMLYTKINNIAFFKVCKKLQKNGASDLMKYFVEQKSSHTYEFLSGSQKVFLSLLENPEYECPICLETEINSKVPIVILNCGHTVCFSCFQTISGVYRVKGTLYNRICAVNSRFLCPICRKKGPLETVNEWNFYPSISLTKMN
jgi:rubrerythrin